jgi:hypothetical protein
MNQLISFKIALFLSLFFLTELANGQGAVFSIMGGPTMSTQTVNGFERDPFFRFHLLAVMESSSDISPNAALISLGYHTKGSAVNSSRYYNPNTGGEQPGSSSSMEFHNLSLSLGIKQRKEVGSNFLSYGFGVRLDYTLSTDFDPIFIGLQGTENKFMYGLNLDVGFEFPLSELVSTTVEFGFSPDLSAQIFIPRQDTGYQNANGSPIIIPESFVKNIIFEARVGFRFWRKIEYID